MMLFALYMLALALALKLYPFELSKHIFLSTFFPSHVLFFYSLVILFHKELRTLRLNERERKR